MLHNACRSTPRPCRVSSLCWTGSYAKRKGRKKAYTGNERMFGNVWMRPPARRIPSNSNSRIAIAEVASLRRDEETLVETLSELRVRVATERQRKENLQRQRQPMAIRLAELEDLIGDRQRDIANYAARVEQFASENLPLCARIEQLQIEQSEAEADVGRLLQDRAQQVEALEAVDLNLGHLRKPFSDCQGM